MIVGLLAVAALIVAALIVKRVPVGSEAVRVTWSGNLVVYDSGYHFISPGTRDFIVYPTGSVRCRYPKYGSAEVSTETGEPVAVAIEVELDVPPGSSRVIYERFSENFEAAVRRLIQAAVETEAAGAAPTLDRREFLENVVKDVRAELEGLGVSVTSFSMPIWNRETE